MICLPNQLPLLTYGVHEVVQYESRWLTDSILEAAEKAGHQDWWFAHDISKAVIEYLRERFPSAFITIDQLYDKIARVLGHMGWDDIAAQLDRKPPPVKISLMEIAELASHGYELEFFRILRHRLEEAATTGCQQILLHGLRDATKHLCRTARWSRACDQLTSDIVDFTQAHFYRITKGADGAGIVLK
jgi:hypothetical protein